MKVYTKTVYQMLPDGGLALLEEESYEWCGPVALCKTSSGEKDAANTTKALTQTMMQYFGQTYANQQSVLQSLRDSTDALVKAGPGQYGFTAAEDAALRTQASAGTAGAYEMAKQATGEQLAAVGGGNVFLPSGVAEEMKQKTALAAAQVESGEQLNITKAGFETGRENWRTAVGEQNTIASLENPEAYGSMAQGGAQAGFQQQRQMANDPSGWGIAGGILGGMAGQAVGGWASGGFKMPG